MKRLPEGSLFLLSIKKDRSFTVFYGWKMGLEPTTPGTTIQCSNQLSYIHHLGLQIYNIFFQSKTTFQILREKFQGKFSHRKKSVALFFYL